MESMILEVAIDTPLRQVFDYRPADGEGVPVPGTRVLVPFGRRQVIGIVVSQKERSEHSEDRLKRILRSIDPQPTLDAPLLKLLRWAADYYHHPLGEALATALPKLAREGAALLEAVEVWHLTDAGRAALAAGEPRRAPRQRAVLEALQHRTEGPERAGTTAVLGTEAVLGTDAALLDDTLPGWRDAARALRDRGWVERGTRGAARASPAAPAAPAAPATAAPPATPRRPAPTAAQQAALEAICARDRDSYHAWL
jgi:primosomal protein N' (replication factor Y)